MDVMDILIKHPSVYILIATGLVLLLLLCYTICKGKHNLCTRSHKEDATPNIVISNPVFLHPLEAEASIPGFVNDTDGDDDVFESSEDEVELRNTRSNLPQLNVVPRGGRSIQFPTIDSSDSSSSPDNLRSSWSFTRMSKKKKRTGSGSNISLTETADDIIYDSMRSMGPLS